MAAIGSELFSSHSSQHTYIQIKTASKWLWNDLLEGLISKIHLGLIAASRTDFCLAEALHHQLCILWWQLFKTTYKQIQALDPQTISISWGQVLHHQFHNRQKVLSFFRAYKSSTCLHAIIFDLLLTTTTNDSQKHALLFPYLFQ